MTGVQTCALPISDADVLLVKLLINNRGARRYSSEDPATGGRPIPSAFGRLDPRTGKAQQTWAAQDPCVYEADHSQSEGGPAKCLDSKLPFGGAFPWEVNMLALSEMAAAESWELAPSLDDIQAAMREIGDPRRVVISIYFRNPYVLDDASGMKEAGALLATFGVSDQAQLDVISGRVPPRGRLPFALPKTEQAVLDQNSDAPGYAETLDGALYPYGYGRSY